MSFVYCAVANLIVMNTTCPKCKKENHNETITFENNPNLITCEECRYNYFVELKLVYKKAYQNTNEVCSLVKCNGKQLGKQY